MVLEDNNKPPSDLNDIVGWARFYFNTRGVNCVPCGTKYKDNKTLLAQHGVEWKDFQRREMRVQEHEGFIAKGLYQSWQGLAVSVGKVYQGPYKDKWVTAFDADNQKGIDLIRHILGGNDRYQTLQDLVQDHITERHSDRCDKCHVIVYSEVPFRHFGGMASKFGKDAIERNEVPGVEIKSKSGVIFSCPSLHYAGKRYEIIGTALPKKILTGSEVFECECRIEDVFAELGITELNEDGKFQ